MSEFEELLQAQEQQVNLENDLMEDMMMPSLDKVIRTAAGNVMVDQSPLQPQLQKNKECKLNNNIILTQHHEELLMSRL